MEIIKDIIYSILILACIISILGIAFYDKISLSKVIPTSEEYVMSNKMKQGLEDKNFDDIEEVIVNYSIDASDLKKYEKTNEYDEGRKAPFANIMKNESNNSNSSSNNNINNNNINNDSGNFYEDDGTK